MQGFTVLEVLVVLALLGALYAFVFINVDARGRSVSLDASLAQARLWADAAETRRSSGTLEPGSGDAGAVLGPGLAPARTPFGGAYRVSATTRTAVVSFDVPASVRDSGVVHLTPSVFGPTAPMRDKVLLYREAVR